MENSKGKKAIKTLGPDKPWKSWNKTTYHRVKSWITDSKLKIYEDIGNALERVNL